MEAKEDKKSALEMFKKLKEHIGEEIMCGFWHYGTPALLIGKLRNVEYYRGIKTDSEFIPFIGVGCAIFAITLKDSKEVLYHNPNIEVNYDRRSFNDVEKAKAVFYGDEITFKQRTRRINREDDYKKETVIANRKAKLKKVKLIKKGMPYIKEELIEEWQSFVSNNTEDARSCAIIEISIKCMEALNNGGNIDELAEIIGKSDLPIFVTGFIVSLINHFTILLNKIKNSEMELKK